MKKLLKRCNISNSRLMGYEKEAYLSLYLKFFFQESTPKNQMLMLGLAQTSHFGLWDIILPPPTPQVPTSYLNL